MFARENTCTDFSTMFTAVTAVSTTIEHSLSYQMGKFGRQTHANQLQRVAGTPC